MGAWNCRFGVARNGRVRWWLGIGGLGGAGNGRAGMERLGEGWDWQGLVGASNGRA